MSGYVHLDIALIARETEKAFLLVLEGGEETWVPKSVVADAEGYVAGDAHCTVSVQSWWAEKEGLG